MEDGKKHMIMFGGAFLAVGLIMATVVFPFWNLIREDVYEEVVILTNDDGVCYAESKTQVPKTISDCTASAGDTVTIKYGRDLAWAVILSKRSGSCNSTPHTLHFVPISFFSPRPNRPMFLTHSQYIIKDT